MAMNFSSRQQIMAGGDQSGDQSGIPVHVNDNGMTNGHSNSRSSSHYHYNQNPEFSRRATIWMGDVSSIIILSS